MSHDIGTFGNESSNHRKKMDVNISLKIENFSIFKLFSFFKEKKKKNYRIQPVGVLFFEKPLQ